MFFSVGKWLAHFVSASALRGNAVNLPWWRRRHPTQYRSFIAGKSRRDAEKSYRTMQQVLVEMLVMI